MFLKTLSFLACGGLAVAGLRLADSGCPGARVLAPACTSASLDDKKDDKDKPALSGAWVKKEGELKIVFAGKNMMSIYPHGENKVLVIECECTPGKDGLVKAKVTDSLVSFGQTIEALAADSVERWREGLAKDLSSMTEILAKSK